MRNVAVPAGRAQQRSDDGVVRQAHGAPLPGSRSMWLCLRMAHAQTDGLVPEGWEPAGLAHSEPPTGDADPAVKHPPRYDPNWREKIERAKREREEARKARKGKPIVFSTEYPPRLR